MALEVSSVVAKETVSDWKLHLNDISDRPFALVCKNFTKLGSLSVDQFLNAPSDDNVFDLSDDILEIAPRPVTPTPPPELPPSEPSASLTNVTKDGNHASRMQIVARLHQTCQRTFGHPDGLKFEFLEEDGPKSKQCILTITRPNGLSRSYATPPIFSRKNDAKIEAVKIAVEMGALDFIVVGDAADTAKGKKGLVLAPLDTPSRAETSGTEAISATAALPEEARISVKQITDCCVEWRAGLTKPEWFDFVDPKFGAKHGCALRITLSPHSLRVYSVEPVFDTPVRAKQECAEYALAQGVLDYIKHGNGQTQPSVLLPSNSMNLDSDQPAASQITTALTLQRFYDSLPQPFPESFGDKSATEINAPGWLNTIIQSARGGQLSTSFIWISEGTLGLHGCLLRLERPVETKSYLVDARFPKRADAKAAVCLQAMSQGAGSYIRAVGVEVENKVTASMRKWANEDIFPVLGSEFSKIKPRCYPSYEFEKEKDAYGCTMRVILSQFATPEQVKVYKVPVEYRTKVDAKVAVACLAAHEGVIEFVRFRGQPPPAGYIPFATTRNQDTPRGGKRKDHPDHRKDDHHHSADTRARKKAKVEEQDINIESDNVPLLQTKDEAAATAARQRQSKSVIVRDSNNNKVSGSSKRPYASGSSGLVPVSRPATAPQAGRSMGQNRLRSRYGGSGGSGRSEATMTPFSGAPPQTPQYVIPSTTSFSGTHTAADLGPPGHHQNPPYMPPYPGNAGSHVAPYSFAPPSSSAPPPALSVPFQHTLPPPGFSHVNPYYGTPTPTATPPAPAPIYSPPPYAGPHPSPYPNMYQPPQPHPPVQYPQQQFAQQQAQPPNFQSHHHPQHVQVPYTNRHFTPSGPGQSSRIRHSKRHDQKTPKTTKMPPKPSADSSSDPPKDPKTSNPPLTQLAVTRGEPSESHVTALLDYCSEGTLPKPVFHHETLVDGGKKRYKVWIISGAERLELPVTFTNINEGRERVAKQVLGRLRKKGSTS